jgi:hypothetical protein
MVKRRTAARVLVVLASVVAFLAILAVWANRQVLNTDNWTETSTELLQRPVIRDQLAAYLVDQLFTNVDVEAEIRSALPPRAEPLAPAAVSGLRQLADRAAKNALSRPEVQQRWADANREAQKTLLKVLEGGGPNVSTDNGVVVLHLKTMLEDIATRTGVGGRLAAALPASAADLTVLRSDQLDAAQRALKLLRGLPYVLVSLSLVLFGIALALSPDWRRRALRAYGIGFVVGGALALLTRSLAGDALTNALASTAAVEPAIAAGWTISTTLLQQAAAATIFYGVAMILGAWLGGPTRPATALRGWVAPYVRHPAIAYAGLAVLVGLLLWWAPTPATRDPALALVLIVLLALGTEALRRLIGREHPDAVRRPGEFGRARDSVAHAASWVRQGPTASPAVVTGPSRVDELERLGRLRDTGVLDAQEFAAQKRALLAEEPMVTPNGAEVPPPPTPTAPPSAPR